VHELEAIEAALDRSRTRGVCLAFSGPLGLGKSRLLRELEARADARGDLVLSGTGSEWEAAVPYGVTSGVLADYLAALPAPELARLTEGLVPDLLPALPGLATATADRPPWVDAERYRTHRAVRTLVLRLAERKPLAILIDDLHWADGETAELVAHLIRHPPPRTLLAVAFRPGQLVEVAGSAVERGRRDGRMEMFDLAPLTEAESAELVGSGMPIEERASLVRDAAGNPFFLEQLTRRAEETPAGPGAPGSQQTADVPPAVLAAIESELAGLGEDERRLLDGAAVAGEPFEVAVAAVAAQLDQDRALRALDGLLAAELLRPAEPPRRFTFRHPVVRHAVYAASGAGWRIAAHARVAAELREHGAPAVRLAEHVERSARPGDDDAIATLLDAGRAVATQAPAAAARLLQAALDLLPDGPDARRLEVMVSLATSLGGAGRLDEARATLEAVLAELPPDSHELRARAATFVGRLDHALGRQGEARTLVEGTLAALPDGRSREAATLTLELVMDHLLTAEFEPMGRLAESALSLSRAAGDPLLEAASLAGIAHAAQYRRDIPASLHAADAAAGLLDRLDDGACAPLLETFWWLAAAEDVLERWDSCVLHAERGIRLAREYGMSFVFVALTHTLAVTLGWQGQLGRAREAAQATVDASHLSGNPSSVAYAYTTQCFVHTQAGEAREALAAGELAVELGRALKPGLFVALPHANMGAALLLAGEPERARAQLIEARARGALEHWVGRCWWEIWMSGAELALGNLEEAERLAAAAEQTAAEMGLPGRGGAALAARAAVTLAQGDPGTAAESALVAAQILERSGRPSDAARARLLAGRATGSVAELERARAAFIEAGAPRLVDEAARELRRLGRRVARPGRRSTVGGGDGAGTLSGREREIAELVAAGRTNGEIAAALHLSEKTVANHLTRMYAKLDISSRSALAAAVSRS
jgi:DNA-binding CsgD family transcriptional regulator/tetratricopeptide (TPR) repeat protein